MRLPASTVLREKIAHRLTRPVGRLRLHAVAYRLATFLRCIESPGEMADWPLTSLQLKLIGIVRVSCGMRVP